MAGTFVSVGNAKQPFNRLLDAVTQCAKLPQPVVIQHGHSIFPKKAGFESVDFMDMAIFTHHINSADLIIIHAGAGSIIHTFQAGKVPLVMARTAALGEHVNDHQLQLVAALVAEKRLVAFSKAEELPASIKQVYSMHNERLKTGKQPPSIAMIGEILADEAKRLGKIG